MQEKNFGNRRSEKELEGFKIEQNKVTYALCEQTKFIGTEQQLDMMQNLERAYIDGNPLVSDEEWDLLKRKYNYEESIISTAPSGRNWVKMMSPLPSIDKAGNIQELRSFLKRFAPGKMYLVECKLDGLTANVVYEKVNTEKGIMFVRKIVTSRGNGRYGLQLHERALSGVKINRMPKRLKAESVLKVLNSREEMFTLETLPDTFELRGEAVIKKTKEAINKYGKNAVWRSVVSGMFNRKIPANIPGLIQYLYGMHPNTFVHDVMRHPMEERHPNNLVGWYCFNDLATKQDLNEARLFVSLVDKNNIKGVENLTEERIDALLKRLIRKGDSVELRAVKRDGEIQFEVYVTLKNDKECVDQYWFKCEEEIDFVSYSASIGDSNIDTPEIVNLHDETDPAYDVKYVGDVELLAEAADFGVTYTVTDDENVIIQKVCDFYGVDLLEGDNYKRNLDKPRLRNLYEYAIDGVVIKPLDSDRESQGMYFRNSRNNPNKIVGPKYPEDQIAVKLLSEIVRVKLERIEKNKTSLNNVACQGVLDKPYLTESGAWVERVNLHNEHWLEENSWIKEGEEYGMVMSMDIIPVLLNHEDFPIN